MSPDVEPFLLSVEHKPNGYTHLTYDYGVSKRLTTIVPTENAASTLSVPSSDLLALLVKRNTVPALEVFE